LVHVESSGTHGHDGWSADSRSVSTGHERGYDLRAHKARTFDASDFGRCDALLALDASHAEWLLKRAPSPVEKDKVALLMVTAADAQRRGEDVADPYYEDAVFFERVVDQCEAAAAGLVAALSAAVAAAGAEPAARRAALGAALSRLLRGGGSGAA
jgi:protein-tyrosine phosphatase